MDMIWYWDALGSSWSAWFIRSTMSDAKPGSPRKSPRDAERASLIRKEGEGRECPGRAYELLTLNPPKSPEGPSSAKRKWTAGKPGSSSWTLTSASSSSNSSDEAEGAWKRTATSPARRRLPGHGAESGTAKNKRQQKCGGKFKTRRVAWVSGAVQDRQVHLEFQAPKNAQGLRQRPPDLASELSLERRSMMKGEW